MIDSTHTLRTLIAAFEDIKLLYRNYEYKTETEFEKDNRYKAINAALKNINEIYLCIAQDKEFALQLYKSDEFKLLDSEAKTTFAAEQIAVAMEMLKNKELDSLESRWLNVLTMGFVLNLSTVLRGGGIFVCRWHEKNPAEKSDRELFCFEFAKHKSLVEKLSPTAKIFLFAFLKKSEIYSRQNNQLDKEISARIKNAYTIETNYNPKEIGMWDKMLLPNLVGGFGIGDYMGRMEELLSAALYNNQYEDAHHPGDALAEILVSERCFDERFAIKMKNPYFNSRLELGLKYPKVAILLITDPKCRGTYKDEITADHIDKLIEKHRLSNWKIVVERQRAREEIGLEFAMLNKELEELNKLNPTVGPKEIYSNKGVQKHLLHNSISPNAISTADPVVKQDSSFSKTI